jgi:uncharacterized membrane-anchored protein
MITAANVAWPDALYRRFGQAQVTGLICLAVVVTLVTQFRVRRYRALVFWPALITVSVAGTELANGLPDTLHLPYAVVALLYLVLLAGLLIWWRTREGTLSLREIDTRRREGCYWGASLLGFALGTAAVHAIHLNIAVWAGIVLCIVVAWKGLRLNGALVFWAAYVVTRPLGTSVQGLLAGLGQWPVTIGFAGVVLVLVGYLAVSRTDEPAPS